MLTNGHHHFIVKNGGKRLPIVLCFPKPTGGVGHVKMAGVFFPNIHICHPPAVNRWANGFERHVGDQRFFHQILAFFKAGDALGSRGGQRLSSEKYRKRKEGEDDEFFCHFNEGQKRYCSRQTCLAGF